MLLPYKISVVHIGMVAELIEDARLDGATDEDLAPLFRSAEGYIRMWEKAEARAGVRECPEGRSHARAAPVHFNYGRTYTRAGGYGLRVHPPYLSTPPFYPPPLTPH